ncbi:hypothetical protein ROHU_026075 [Labeo rohita]|uniref:Uncharacterized protein n=1 Tax=Labeo rohita TaxID=84645 RepID=A0A498MHB8_LABRO|nr:hypothetical protein ROHU_026075 [Labeo rohita]
MRIRAIYSSRSKSASLNPKSTPAAKAANRSSKAPNSSRLTPPLSRTRSGSSQTSGRSSRPQRAWAAPQFSPHSLASRFGSAFHCGSPGLSTVCNRPFSFLFQRLACLLVEVASASGADYIGSSGYHKLHSLPMTYSS